MKSLSQTYLVTASGDSFDYWWDMEGTWVEQPNQRRGGASGVQRCRLNGVTYYIKKQVGHMFRSPRQPYGSRAAPRHSGDQGAIWLSWTGMSENRPCKGQLLDAIYSCLAEALAKLHNQRWQHGCLYDKHVFFRIRAEDENEVEIALIDLEKCRRKLTVAGASQRDVMQMRRRMPALDGRHWQSFVSAYTRHLNLKSSREKLWLSLTP